MTPDELAQVTLAVLAGGAGSRMGMPKAKLRIGGEPILAWLLERLDWRGPTMLVLAPAIETAPGIELYNLCARDPVDGQGPLRGILTALENLQTPMLAVVTVDMPGINRDQLIWLIERLVQQPTLAGMMCRVKSGHSERIEPFPSIFRATAMQPIAERIAGGQRSVHDLITDSRFATVEPAANWPAKTWTNLNMPADLATFESTSDRIGNTYETANKSQ